MRILITGGCGFIGSNFIRYYLKKNSKDFIINLDKLTYAGRRENLKDLESNPRYKFVKGDIANKKDVEKVMKEGIDAIINFAAESISKDVYLPIWNAGKIEILTLEEIFKRASLKNKIIKQGNVEVINFSSKNYKTLAYKGGIGYWMPIKQISRHFYKGEIIRLIQKWGEVEVTPNHSIYDCNFNLTTPTENPEILSIRNINHIAKKNKYKNFSGEKLKSLLRILGAYISEGWTTYNKKNGSYQFGISNRSKKFILDCKRDLIKLGFKPNITITKDKIYQILISNKSFYNFARKKAGYDSHCKFIPSFVFQLRKEFQEEFLKMLIKGDGEVIENKNYKTIRYTTTSKKLATGLSLLLTLLKYNYSLVKDKRYNAYTLNFGNDYTISLLKKRYEVLDYSDYVYDISVDNLKNFVCGVGNIVVHNTHVDRSIVRPDNFIKTNVYGTYILLESAKKLKIKKFLHISTDEVYGSIKKGSFKETSPLSPSSPYSASKAGADHLVLSYYKTYKVPILITRSSNNYGPYQFPEKVIPVFIISALKNKKLPVYAKGENKRDWIFVLDNCKAIEKVFKKGKIGEIYNIASGYEIKNIKLAKKILKILNKPFSLIKHVKDRPGHDFRYSIKTDKIKKLGWKPEIKFDEGLQKTINWYIENRWWWEKRREKG